MANNNLLRSDLQDKKVSFAITFQFYILITNYTFKHIFNIADPVIREVISFIFMLLVGIMFLISLPIVFRRIKKVFIFTYLVSFAIFLINIVIYPQNTIYIIEISFWFFLLCLPNFLYYLAINNKNLLHRMLMKSAYYQIALGVFFVINPPEEYDMVLSYLILVPIILLISKIYNKFNFVDLGLIIFGMYILLAFGARGPLVAIIMFGMLLVLVDILTNSNKTKSIIVLLLIMITIFTGFIYLENLVSEAGQFENSRTITVFSKYDEVDFSAGRFDIYKQIIEEIQKNPIFGYGLAGDRVILAGTYAHNIFLEIVVQFGLWGVMLLLLLIFYWVCGIFLNRNNTEQNLAIMFFGIGLVQLFMSGSYLTSSNFWLFMGICVSSVHTRGKSSITQVGKLT